MPQVQHPAVLFSRDFSVADSVILDVSVWRSDYERYREIYGVASSLVSRLRLHLIAASESAQLSKIERDGLLGIISQIDDERRGR